MVAGGETVRGTFIDYPYAGRKLDVGGANLHYLDEGPADGEPVLMLHGNPTWSFYYRHVVAALSDRYRAIVPDHIGMGLSDKPDEAHYAYTLSRRVDDLEKLLDHLQLEKPIALMLHDWGGMIGMALATRRPGRIGRVIAMNTGGFMLPRAKRLPWQIKLARFPKIGALLVRGLNAFSAGAVKHCAAKPMSPDVRRAYLAPYDSWRNRLAVHRFIQDIPLRPGDAAFEIVANVERNLARFCNLPVLLCWGMEDFVFDRHFLDRWIAFFPDAEVHRFEDAGHYVLEDAGEEIIPLIRRFLDSHPSVQPA